MHNAKFNGVNDIADFQMIMVHCYENLRTCKYFTSIALYTWAGIANLSARVQRVVGSNQPLDLSN